MQIYISIERQTDRQTDSHADRLTVMQTDRRQRIDRESDSVLFFHKCMGVYVDRAITYQCGAKTNNEPLDTI